MSGLENLSSTSHLPLLQGLKQLQAGLQVLSAVSFGYFPSQAACVWLLQGLEPCLGAGTTEQAGNCLSLYLPFSFFPSQIGWILEFQSIRLVGQQELGTASLAPGISWAFFYHHPTPPNFHSLNVLSRPERPRSAACLQS